MNLLTGCDPAPYARCGAPTQKPRRQSFPHESPPRTWLVSPVPRRRGRDQLRATCSVVSLDRKPRFSERGSSPASEKSSLPGCRSCAPGRTIEAAAAISARATVATGIGRIAPGDTYRVASALTHAPIPTRSPRRDFLAVPLEHARPEDAHARAKPSALTASSSSPFIFRVSEARRRVRASRRHQPEGLDAVGRRVAGRTPADYCTSTTRCASIRCQRRSWSYRDRRRPRRRERDRRRSPAWPKIDQLLRQLRRAHLPARVDRRSPPSRSARRAPAAGRARRPTRPVAPITSAITSSLAAPA